MSWKSRSRRRAALLSAALAALATTSVAFANTITGPSSSESPYVVRGEPGVVTHSILTVGDSVNDKPNGDPYRMVGIPDGLGAFDNGDGTFTLLMNHELGVANGVIRAHGAAGAFVSKWTIRKGGLEVLHGEDLIQQVATWNTLTNSHNAPSKGIVLGRFCSADLPALSAFYDAGSGLGFNGRIFMDGEEVGAEGRAFGHGMDGTSYELAHLGKFSWENSVANPATGVRTAVAGLDDSGGGQVDIYLGTKTNAGSPVDMAGLTNGNLYGVKVTGLLAEIPASGIPSGTAFTLYNFGDVSATTGAALEGTSLANGVTGFLRPEDGAWDPRDPSKFYFVTTDAFNGHSRLWRLNFSDLDNLAAGGTIDMLLDGSEGQQMMDNLTITDRGQVVIQEDPGNQNHLAKIWQYEIATDSLRVVAAHDPARFTPGAPGFLTRDEESSGIIDMQGILGEGWFLLDVQAHYSLDAELVQGGQLLAIQMPPGKN